MFSLLRKGHLVIVPVLRAAIKTPVRNLMTTETGALLPEPKKIPFGIPKVILAVLPGLYLGAIVSKEGAAFLEENDIFVPEEDDNDDDD